MSEPRDLWAKAPANLITDSELTLNAIRVYLWLDLRAGQRGFWYGARQEIADAVHLSIRAVSRASASLRERGYITTTREGTRDGINTYEIAARTGQQRPVRLDSVGTRTDIGRDASGSTEKKHPFNHRSIPRSNKRSIITPQTDWDQNHRSMEEKIGRLIG